MKLLHSTALGPELAPIDTLIGDLGTLPLSSLSPLVLEVMAAPAELRRAALDRLEHADPRLVLRALQIANAASFGTTRRIRNLPEGVELVGMPLVGSFLSVADVFLAFEGVETARLSMEHFETYSVRVARLARRFAEPHGLGAEAFAAGALLDVGKLVLATRNPAGFIEAIDLSLDTPCPSHVAEQRVLGVAHPGVGARALEHWGLPPVVVEMVAFHHEPGRSANSQVLMACVHAADALLGIHACCDPESMLDEAFVRGAGVGEDLSTWRAQALDEAARVLPRTAGRAWSDH